MNYRNLTDRRVERTVPENPENERVGGSSQSELAEIILIGERFRKHRIFREVNPSRGVRYRAHATTIDAQPHTIITGDLAELRRALEQAEGA